MKRIVLIISILALLVSALAGCAAPRGESLGNVVILGDSFSTFKGHIPEGYAYYYSADTNLGIRRVEDAWWHRLVTETGSKLVLNSSYSGSPVCNTGYGGEDASDFSFVSRLSELIEDGFFEEESIDTLIVYGGLNDCWAQSPRGEIKYEGITEADLYSFFPALSFIFKSVGEASPDTRLVLVIESQLDDQMKDGMRTIAAHYEVETVEPEGIELLGSHPTALGMKSLAEQIGAALKKTGE